MAKNIIVSIMPEETRMALIEDGDLLEVSIERTDHAHIVGNIYKGKVKNVLPGMQAVFVDIGHDKNAFLYTGDISPQELKVAGGGGTLTIGQDIIVQIIKDAIGTKGPRATTNLTVPGRYIVLMPTVDYVGISRRIDKESERERLKELAGNVRAEGTGLIVRTVAQGKAEEDLKNDAEYLYKLWHSLAARARRAQSPALLYRDVDMVIRIVRDHLTADIDQLVIDQREAYGRVCDLVKTVSPELLSKVVLYDGTEDVFNHFGIEKEIDKLGQRCIWLKCGGYIIIDKTEALTVVDVNTGKYVGDSSLEDTVFHTNLEAAAEIARQLRLRDIGGIIIIDFIDMDTDEHKKAILDALEGHLKKDRTKTNVIGLTGLGLVEMTRKKSRQNLESILYTDCPCCEGRGRVRSPETVVINIRRRLRKLKSSWQGQLALQVHPTVAAILNRSGEVALMEKEAGRKIIVEAVGSMHPEVFTILHSNE
ncbi:Ribonuclease G [bioreactor metagenome]|uniref:Ribonuclease G n=1 Tax=bioreactor metagenome TaxID=1076179 RepID=A0A644T8W7_9ZZZZ|nr:Rne/Rng family ribonuclease [Negativicutes bacterium]